MTQDSVIKLLTATFTEIVEHNSISNLWCQMLICSTMALTNDQTVSEAENGGYLNLYIFIQ